MNEKRHVYGGNKGVVQKYKPQILYTMPNRTPIMTVLSQPT